MPKKNNQSPLNFFQIIGNPIYKFIIYLFSFFAFVFLFLLKLPQLISTKQSQFTHKVYLCFPKIKFKLKLKPSLKKKPPKTNPKTKSKSYLNPFKLTIFFTISGFLIGYLYYTYYYSLPNPNQLRNYPSKLTTQILDRNGILLYKLYKDENRTLIKLDDLPNYITNAFISAEDKNFYHHFGFSISGIIRALYRNFSEDKLEGGSTITQQLVKNTLLSSEKTIDRKIKELVLSLRVETIYSKNEILEMYLNQVGFGGPAYGIQEAARQYFDTDAKNLTLSQAAYLAGLPQAPSRYSPFGDHPEMAKSRQQLILSQMYKLGYINENELNSAIDEKLNFKSAKIEIKAPHFVMYIKDLLTSKLGQNLIDYGGLIVTTTLDVNIQDFAQQTVTDEISKLSNYHVTNGSALVINPQTEEILAMVGSKDYFDISADGQVNLTTSLRQPGSSIKPLNYALAFENGLKPSSLIDDKPITFNIVGQEIWTPKNYDNRFHGTITLRQALASSYNIPSIILLTQNGIPNFVQFVQKMGITTWNDPTRFGLSMALGSLEVKMTELATAYSAFANQGNLSPLVPIINIQKNDGTHIYLDLCSDKKDENLELNTNTCKTQNVFTSNTAFLISDILADNSARAPAFGFNSVLNLKNTPVSVKTGTSNDLRDNWTVGFTPNFLVATWVGNNNNQPMSNIASGITGASPIWAKIMSHLISQYPHQTKINKPDDLVSVVYCPLTNTLTCSACPNPKKEYFSKDKVPSRPCTTEEINRLLEIQKEKQKQNPTPQIL